MPPRGSPSLWAIKLTRCATCTCALSTSLVESVKKLSSAQRLEPKISCPRRGFLWQRSLTRSGRPIIDNAGAEALRIYICSGASSGMLKLKVTPTPSFRAIQMRPEWASTIDRQIARPIPIPASLLVMNGSKIFSVSWSPVP